MSGSRGNLKRKIGVTPVGRFVIRRSRTTNYLKKQGRRKRKQPHIRLKDIDNVNDIPYIILLKPHRFYVIDVINRHNDDGVLKPLVFWSWFYDPISARVAITKRLKGDFTRYWVLPGTVVIENQVEFFKADHTEAGYVLHHYAIDYPPEFVTSRQRTNFRKQRRRLIRKGIDIYQIWWYDGTER